MTTETLTRKDLEIFKEELKNEILEAIRGLFAPPRKWLKSYEVREMLGISSGTLQNMRNSGTLSFSKMGGLMYYDYGDIQKLIEKK